MIGNELLKQKILDQAFSGNLIKSSFDNVCYKEISLVMKNYDSIRKPISKTIRNNLNNRYNYYGATGKIDMIDDYIFDGNYLLIGEDGGNFYVDKDNCYVVNGKFWANNHVHVLSANNAVTNNYIKHYLNSLNFVKMGLITGTAIPKLNQKNLNSIKVPMISLNNQAKIVKKIEELFELIDKKEKNDKEKEKLKTLLKEKILDSAIHGELVEQNESESNSIEYIKNIQKLKENLILKKELKRDSKINCNKPQIVLPRGWNWVRLGDLGIYKKGPFGSSLTKDMFVADSPNSYKVYEQKNAIQKDWKLGNYFITKEKYDSMKSFIIKPNDIIVSCAGTIGEIYVIPQNARAGIINQALMKITLFDNSIMDFYIMYFDHVLIYESRKKGKGTAIRNIPPFDVLKNIYVPLPPIEEQHRIMNKIEECFKLIEQL